MAIGRGTERIRLWTKVGNTRIEIQGAKYFYEDFQDITGMKVLNDFSGDDNVLMVDGNKAKAYLVKLVAVLSGQFAGGVGTNQQQDDSTRRFVFYCDPEKAEECLLKLRGKDVDPGLGLGSMKIIKVYRPRRRAYV